MSKAKSHDYNCNLSPMKLKRNQIAFCQNAAYVPRLKALESTKDLTITRVKLFPNRTRHRLITDICRGKN